MNKQELLEELRKLDEVLLLELLNITSEDICDAFMDRVIEHEDSIRRQVEEL
jgi:hypothetical protein